jgi:hypothetical protein
MNAIKAQKIPSGDISSIASQFLSIVHTMHDRCMSSLEVGFSSHLYAFPKVSLIFCPEDLVLCLIIS